MMLLFNSGKAENNLNLKSKIAVCLFLSIAVIAFYFPVIHYDFILYDDDDYITENYHVRAGLTFESLKWAFTSTEFANWHPLTWLSHMLDITLFGMNPGFHHLTNVLFHLANTLILFFVFNRMTRKFWQSAFVAGLFALHPLHIESVAWVSERKDVLSTFFWMLTMFCYIRYVEMPAWKTYLPVIIFFIFGLLSKPMLVTLPFVLILIDYYPLQRFSFDDFYPKILRIFYEKLPLIGLAILSSIITYIVQHRGGAVRDFIGYPLDIRISNALVSYITYLKKMVLPWGLTVFYPHPGDTLTITEISISGILFLCITIFAIRTFYIYPYVAFGWFWYVGTLVPVIGLIQIGTQARADRYTYIPLIGIFVIIVWGISELFSIINRSRILLYGCILIVLSIMMFFSVQQVRYWENDLILFRHMLNVTENNFIGHNNLGTALLRNEDVEGAVFHFREALRIKQADTTAHNNLGAALAKLGKISEAKAHFETVLRLKSDNADAYYNLGNLYNEIGDRQKAMENFLKAVSIKPDHTNAHYNIGTMLIEDGNPQQAVFHFQKVLSMWHDDAQACNQLGIAFAMQGNKKEAAYYFRKAIDINHSDMNARQNLEILMNTQ